MPQHQHQHISAHPSTAQHTPCHRSSSRLDPPHTAPVPLCLYLEWLARILYNHSQFGFLQPMGFVESCVLIPFRWVIRSIKQEFCMTSSGPEFSFHIAVPIGDDFCHWNWWDHTELLPATFVFDSLIHENRCINTNNQVFQNLMTYAGVIWRGYCWIGNNSLVPILLLVFKENISLNKVGYFTRQ